MRSPEKSNGARTGSPPQDRDPTRGLSLILKRPKKASLSVKGVSIGGPVERWEIGVDERHRRCCHLVTSPLGSPLDGGDDLRNVPIHDFGPIILERLGDSILVQAVEAHTNEAPT
jgi:hypothetical protein